MGSCTTKKPSSCSGRLQDLNLANLEFKPTAIKMNHIGQNEFNDSSVNISFKKFVVIMDSEFQKPVKVPVLSNIKKSSLLQRRSTNPLEVAV